MSIEAIKEQLLAIPEIAVWPEVALLLDRPLRRRAFNYWDYPGIAARAMGAGAEVGQPAATAICCSLLSIHLVDDILDEDPRGHHQTWGVGKAANLALALQAAGARVLADRAPAEHQAALQRCLADLTMATSWGQQVDALDRPGEAAYWETIRLKTPPLIGSALQLGAILGGASEATARAIAGLGLSIGEMVQINDDLHDALHTPACPDWFREGGNLAILYARLATHPGRARFEALRTQVADEALLRQAQDLLIECGAVSYCAYALIESYKRGKALIASLGPVSAEPLDELLDSHIAPLLDLLRSLGVKTPENLLRR